jgi:Ulp1 family protease
LRCEKNQHEPTAEDHNRKYGHYGRIRKQQQEPTYSKPKPIPKSNFYPSGDSQINTSHLQQPQLRGTNPPHKNSTKRLGAMEYNPLTPYYEPVNGGASVLQGQQQQQRQWQTVKRQRPPAPQNNYRAAQRRSTRQTSLDAVIKVDTHGTDANPISLLDTDDDEHENSEEGGASDVERLVRRAASIADRSFQQRVTRLASGVINPSTVMRLQGLRCLMPPEGGPGAVEFTAADLGRLAPDEFLNDTAIDYYLRYVRMNLERERPEDAARCYFFNSFFFKKLSEKTGGGMNAGAAASYAKVKKWTRGVDIFAKDYVFVPIHDHLHWSLIIICHPGAEVPKQTRKRPGSAAGSGNTDVSGEENKKRSVGSDGVVVLDGNGHKDKNEDDEENPTVTAHRKALQQNHQKGNNAAADEEEEIEIVHDKEPEHERVQDPRIAPHPEPFFLHLDSLIGGHSSEVITKTLKSYLKCEWDARIEDPKGVEDSVPKKWAAEQVKKKKERTKKSTDDDADDAGPSSSAPLIPKRLFGGMEKTKMPVPKQDNHCDCGLFVCAFVEFFTASLPKALNVSALHVLKKNYHEDGIDLWEGSMRRGGSTGEEEPAWYPGFLTKHWFKHENASNLRWELLRMVLVHMAVRFFLLLFFFTSPKQCISSGFVPLEEILV